MGQSTPFELHDDAYVLNAMRSRDNQQNDTPHEITPNGGESSGIPSLYRRHHLPHPSRSNTMVFQRFFKRRFLESGFKNQSNGVRSSPNLGQTQKTPRRPDRSGSIGPRSAH